ncbi:hypothetical protein [Salinactinospora qingdaonensis]|uniref:Pterin-4-alpha-carbinolamine dehydratase n=1 Tax=Salinactinospora qingdaonensis TaxID=702744 RepID=A0ABP7G1V5_9ACTN
MRRLSDNEISVALASLVHWEYDHGGLARAAPREYGDVEATAARVAGADRDHVSTSTTSAGRVLRVASPREGGVTVVDVDLAVRIEQELTGGPALAR